MIGHKVFARALFMTASKQKPSYVDAFAGTFLPWMFEVATAPLLQPQTMVACTCYRFYSQRPKKPLRQRRFG